MLNLKDWIHKDFYIEPSNIIGLGLRPNPDYANDLSKPKEFVDIVLATGLNIVCPIKTEESKRDLLSHFNLL
jgi:hypothetical protein